MKQHIALNPYLGIHAYGLGDLLHQHARDRPDLVAVIEGDLSLTYRQLDERVNRLAAVLRSKGVTRGDRILWLGQNSFRVLETLLAGARVGAIVCPANWRWSAGEIAFALDDFDPKIVFWQEKEIGAVNREARTAWRPDSNWICHDGCEGEAAYEELIAAADPETSFDAVEPSTPLLAIYTAGFSGRPGAALLSHESVLLVSWLSSIGQKVDERSGYLVSGPMFHLGVLMGAMATFLCGGRCAFVSRVDAEEMLGMIDAHKLTHAFIAAPTIAQMRELNQSGKYDVSSIFSDPQMSDYRIPLVMPADAPQMKHMGGYGQTEIGGLVNLLWFGGSAAGRASPFIQVMVGDENGEEKAPGETGEILARGPLVMCGYWNRPEENARRIVKGWHRTNDLGKRLPDGSLVFVGPKTTMIKTGIENVYPAEVEACLRQHEGVADVCVIGVPDPTWDQNIKAVIVRKPGSAHTPEELIEHCRRHLASYKKPKIVTFTDQIPRNGAGAIDRDAVDAAFGGGGYPSVG
jgi:long-chain acyl-CoA synthetase